MAYRERVRRESNKRTNLQRRSVELFQSDTDVATAAVDDHDDDIGKANWNEVGALTALSLLCRRARAQGAQLCKGETKAGLHWDIAAVTSWSAASFLKDTVCAKAPWVLLLALAFVKERAGRLVEQGAGDGAGGGADHLELTIAGAKRWIDAIARPKSEGGSPDQLLSLNGIVHTLLYASSGQGWVSQMGVALALSMRATGGQPKTVMIIEGKYAANGRPARIGVRIGVQSHAFA